MSKRWLANYVVYCFQLYAHIIIMALVVASIDFGTTYSGWALSFKSDFDREPSRVYTYQWVGGNLISAKGLTF